jgi:diaminopimelate decarboxylase
MQDWLTYRNGHLHADGVSLESLAERFGTPTYVYSRREIEEAYSEFQQAIGHRKAMVCYALKANSNLAIIEVLARAGAGFDIVSGGELARVIAAGADPSRVVFSGVGKSASEIEAALTAGVRCFNVESEAELHRLDAIARARGVQAPVSLRVNPDVDARTHPYISTGLKENKFGIPHAQAPRVYRIAQSLAGIRVTGIDCHIGSQITDLAPFEAALDKVLELVRTLAAEGIELHHLDLGGGLGIRYRDETPPSRAALMQAVFERLDREPGADRYEVFFEFGRSIVGNAGLLLSRVEYIKRNDERCFAVVDAGMNDLMRPALYEAYHDIQAVRPRDEPAVPMDVVGPVCESGDWLGRDRSLSVVEGDLVAVLSAGAYGMAMSSNYNTRPRPAEVLLDRGQVHLIRSRETLESLWAFEHRLPASA